MSTDRPINLDLGMPSSGSMDLRQGMDQQGQPQRRQGAQVEQDAANLRELLNAQRSGASATESNADAARAQQQPNSPFDLFGKQTRGPSDAASANAMANRTTPQDVPANFDQTLSEMAQRLLVNDGSSGRRAVQIQLSADTLPGVVMNVSEDAGAVLAEFTCSLEASRERLARNAQWLADGLHQSLQRDVCLRVQTDDPEDRAAVEVRAGT